MTGLTEAAFDTIILKNNIKPCLIISISSPSRNQTYVKGLGKLRCELGKNGAKVVLNEA